MQTESHEKIQSIVLLTSIFLCFMIFSYELKKCWYIPVAPVLLIIGIIFNITNSYTNLFKSIILLITNIEIEAISLSFFPIMLLAASISLNWHTMRRSLFQIIILSTTVMISCTSLNALSMHYILGFNFKPNNLLILGLILSVTDHTIVVNILKELKASEELKSLLIGETILSEATVLVFFKVLHEKGVDHTVIERGGILLLRLSLGGFCLGIAFALIVGYVLKRVFNDFFVEANLILLAAYLLFYVCEMKAIEASGAIALVTFGLYMSAYGKSFISPSVEKRIYDFLELIERNMESILFIIAGVIFSSHELYREHSLNTKDYFLLLGMFPLTYVIRFSVLLIHYPLLNWVGTGLNIKELIVITLGGVKGVISIGLTLVCFQNLHLDPYFRAIVSYFGIGIAGLSIIFGELSTKIFIKRLGLSDESNVEQAILAQVLKSLTQVTESTIENLKNNNNLPLVKWDSVLELADLSPLILSTLNTSKICNQHEKPQDLLEIFTIHLNLQKKVFEVEMRRRYLMILIKIYCKMSKRGICKSESSILLIDCCKSCLDRDSLPMSDWKETRKFLLSHKMFVILINLSKIPLIGKFIRNFMHKKIILAYDVASNFIKGHSDTERLIDGMKLNVDEQIFEGILAEAHEQVKYCEEDINTYMIDCFPEVLADVQTKRCCQVILYAQLKAIEEIYKEKKISFALFNSLLASVNSAMRGVIFQRIPEIFLFKDAFINKFSDINPDELKKIISCMNEQNFSPGDSIFIESDPVKGAYFIIRGRIRECSSWINQELIIGDIVGVQYLIEEFSLVYQSSATSLTSTLVVHIPKEIIEIQGMTESLYKKACDKVILMNKYKYNLDDANEVHILRIIQASEIKSLGPGENFKFSSGGLALKGAVYRNLKGFVIKPSKKLKEIIENCIVLIFPKDFPHVYEVGKPLARAFQHYCVKLISMPITMKLTSEIYSDSILETSMVVNITTDRDCNAFKLNFK